MNAPLLGSAELRVRGYNLNRLLTRLSKSVELYRPRYTAPRELAFSVSIFSLKTVFAILQEMCYNEFEVLGSFGLIPALRAVVKRLGLLTCAAIVLCLLWVYNGFIWTITIEGNQRVLKSDIMQSMESAGIKSGVLKSKIDVKALSNILTAEYDDISMVYIKTRGTLLSVSVVETLYKDDTLERNEITPLLAESDGRVDKLLCYQGTPLVKVGDYVKKGEPLIGAYEDRLLPDGITTERLFMKALGEAEMTVFYTHELTFSERTLEYKRTGKSKTSSCLRLFGFDFMKRGKNPFTKFESQSKTQVLFSGCLLPIYKRITVFYELEQVEVLREFAQHEKALRAQALREAKMAVLEGAEITGEYTDASGENGMYRITGVITVKTVVRP